MRRSGLFQAHSHELELVASRSTSVISGIYTQQSIMHCLVLVLVLTTLLGFGSALKQATSKQEVSGRRETLQKERVNAFYRYIGKAAALCIWRTR